jgi:hypothetical protein
MRQGKKKWAIKEKGFCSELTEAILRQLSPVADENSLLLRLTILS